MVNLPHHRRYNWRMMAKHQRMTRKLWLLVVAILLCYLVYQGEELLRSQNEAARMEQAYLGLKLDVLQVAHFGAPGWVNGTGEELDAEIKLNTKGRM